MQKKKSLKQLFPFSWRDLLTMVVLLAAVTGLAFSLKILDRGNSGNYAPLLFALGVFMVSRFTSGYLFGTLSCLISVILVNFIFTYPYFALNFTIAGYPLTFVCMFLTSVMTTAMTTQIKEQERIRLEVEKEKMRANLLRAVSHDLRTPLTSIVGTTSALLENEEKFSPQQRRTLLKESRDDAQWLIRMVENLLSVTRMREGEASIRKSPEAVEEIIGEALRKFQKRFPDISVEVSVPEELLMVPMDAILLEQVVINLLENAVLHGKNPQGIRIEVSCDESWAVFSVSDRGRGIAESAFAHLFDGYLTSTDHSESDSKRNMGIGLSVCRSIIEAHGGQMFAENRKEGGAVFRFTLPR